MWLPDGPSVSRFGARGSKGSVRAYITSASAYLLLCESCIQTTAENSSTRSSTRGASAREYISPARLRRVQEERPGPGGAEKLDDGSTVSGLRPLRNRGGL